MLVVFDLALGLGFVHLGFELRDFRLPTVSLGFHLLLIGFLLAHVLRLLPLRANGCGGSWTFSAAGVSADVQCCRRVRADDTVEPGAFAIVLMGFFHFDL